MAKTFKPAGYNSVSPYFVIEGAEKFVDLLKELFHATQDRTFKRQDGSIMHTEVKIDDSVIMISEATKEFQGNTHMMHVYVPNVDDVYKKALALGCKSLGEPVQKEGDPDRRGGFEDFAGNAWYVSTQVDQ